MPTTTSEDRLTYAERGAPARIDWAQARWIGADPAACETASPPDELAIPAPLIRRRVGIRSTLRRATLHWSGLGSAIAYLDGVRLSPSELSPAPTRYDRTVLYESADLTDLLAAGDHTLGFELGRGKFGEPRPSVWRWHLARWWDHPKLIALLRLDYPDGIETVVSDASWEWTDGPIRSDSLLGGERYDARYRRPGWLAGTGAGAPEGRPVRMASPPGGILRPQEIPPVRVVDELAPVVSTELASGVRVFDFGRQLAGWTRLRLTGESGSTTRISYAEKLLPDGRVDAAQTHVLPPLQADTVTLAGDPLDYEPSFGYRGFRYVEVEPIEGHAVVGDVVARLAHTDVDSIAEFDCDQPVLTAIHEASRRSILDNLHGIFTDTPTYEKNGWTADAMLSLEASMLNFDMAAFYRKWLRDYADAQREDGEIPAIVPAADWGYSDSDSRIRGPIPAWDAAYAEICWAMYRYLGDTRILAEHLPGLVRYSDMLALRWPDHLIGGGIGDWKPPDVDGRCPEGPAVYGTMYAYRVAWIVAMIARVLDEAALAARFAARAREVRHVFVSRYRVDAGDYRGEQPSGYRQSVNATALHFGLVPGPERAIAVERLREDIAAHGGHLNTGAHGTKYLPLVLTQAGRAEDAAAVLTATGFPSYARWFSTGETNLWEGWGDEARSRNHHYFSSPEHWIFEHLVGIAPATPGYRTFRVEPCLIASVGRASGAIETVAGRISVSWERTGEGWRLAVKVPPGAIGRLRPRIAGETASSVQLLEPGLHEITLEG